MRSMWPPGVGVGAGVLGVCRRETGWEPLLTAVETGVLQLKGREPPSSPSVLSLCFGFCLPLGEAARSDPANSSEGTVSSLALVTAAEAHRRLSKDPTTLGCLI